MEAIKAILAKHHFSMLGGRYGCTCGEDYGKVYRNPEQRPRMVSRHDHHVARVLFAAGATLPAGDPRNELRARMAGGEP